MYPEIARASGPSIFSFLDYASILPRLYEWRRVPKPERALPSRDGRMALGIRRIRLVAPRTRRGSTVRWLAGCYAYQSAKGLARPRMRLARPHGARPGPPLLFALSASMHCRDCVQNHVRVCHMCHTGAKYMGAMVPSTRSAREYQFE